jgi:hypothetical protein
LKTKTERAAVGLSVHENQLPALVMSAPVRENDGGSDSEVDRMRRRIFIRWVIVLSAFWIVANWPRHSGLGGFFYRGGFPLSYAWGWGSEKETNFGFFLLDFLIGIVAVASLSFLCTWSRRLPPDK